MYNHPSFSLAVCHAALKATTALASCAFELRADGLVQLLPAGSFRSTDTRPKECAAWVLNAAIAAKVIAAGATLENKTVVDYEHQTMLSGENGQPAPAAGWFVQAEMEWREGEGLFAKNVEWTERAKSMIAAGEYKYISPVFEYDKTTGAVVRILNVALTNFPAIDGMSEVLARAAARMNATPNPESTMNPLLKAILSALGLPETVNEADATAAVVTLRATAGRATEHETTIAALRTQAPDPARFVPIETMTALQTELATLRAASNAGQVDTAVATALAEGKLLPAQEAWAKDLGTKDFAKLKGFLDTAQPIAALKGTQTGGKTPAGGGVLGLTEAQLAVCKSTGIKPEDYKKTLDDQAAETGAA